MRSNWVLMPLLALFFSGGVNAQCKKHELMQISSLAVDKLGGTLLSADMNGDGRDDVISAQGEGVGMVAVYLSASNGAPGGPINSSSKPASAPVGPYYIGTTKNERVFLGRVYDDPWAIYAQVGATPQFRGIKMTTIPTRTFGQFFDINGDGKIDFLFVTPDRRSLALAYGTGNGQFQAPVTVLNDVAFDGTFGFWPAWGDFLGNGSKTLAVGRHWRSAPQPSIPANISIFESQNGQFSKKISCDVPISIGTHIETLVTLRLKNETLLVAAPGQGSIYTLSLKKRLDDPSALPYSCTFTVIPNSNSRSAAVADFNGDGMDDLVWVRQQDLLLYYVLADDKTTADNWKQQTIGVGEAVFNATVGDFNADGMSDVVLKTGKRIIHLVSQCHP
ncbi:FG-GAP repeat domain-containing protein [Cupriavidus taiwanensis]|uniref:VCBS repeat-containing protein n=1 Tax=Cupriavidus taiwanensis (strain DSM 17343 / BCRC 17206 / CCUG 44338 / CIP 107171 / LMG 19424 / R1) TaxID=977880 RepID=B3R9I5_CUPTR|nr:VCBS repeat-containing protein [Cupriavidus taiwanensis]CAQ71560.1 hypothetical protein, putative exported protein [Cupriavidus taiwanensis LMG 19424]